MSFVDQIVSGHHSVVKSLAIIWYRKRLLVYPLLKVGFNLLVLAIASALLGLGAFGIHEIFKSWISHGFIITEGIYLSLFAFIAIVISTWATVIIYTALLKRVMGMLHNKPLTFSKSFDFDKGLSVKLFWWSVIMVVVTGLILAIPFLVPRFSDFIRIILLVAWHIGVLFVLPIFIKKNMTIWKTIRTSFTLAWYNLVAVLSALVSFFFYMIVIGFIFGALGFLLTWLVCYLLAIPFGFGILLPFILVVAIPGLLVIWYLATVAVTLPAVLYHDAGN